MALNMQSTSHRTAAISRVASLVFLLGHACLAASQQPASATKASSSANDRCAAIGQSKLEQTIIESAATQPRDVAVPGANLPGMTGIPGAGPAISGLPPFCRVIGRIQPEAGSDILFEVWMPTENWNGRFTGSGSGGLAGSISFNDLASAVRAGQVGAGTDTGHRGNPRESAWAKGHPERVRDYGWRAIHLTAVIAKKLATEFYGHGPEHSYYVGCSNGGRSALMQASRFPEDYDGIVAGAPITSFIGWAMSTINVIQAQLPPDAAIRPAQAKLLQQEVVRQCDGKDNQMDGLIADPMQCKIDTSRLACGVADSATCFSPPQLTALQKIYDGPHDAKGRQVALGYPPAGAEVGIPVPFFGWDGVIFTDEKNSLDRAAMPDGLLKDFATKPFADTRTFDFNKDPAALKAAVGADLDVQPNLARYFDRGGKLIIWHGWADAAIPPQGTLSFYKDALRSSGTHAKDSMRLFMVPGVQHCAGGTGAGAFGQIGAPPPGDTPERNIAAAMQAWVETGRTPESLIGRRGMDAMAPAAPNAAEKQRLLCAYPSEAMLQPGADPDKASSYTCVQPKLRTTK
jgi:Tannase and feruloyl esterase